MTPLYRYSFGAVVYDEKAEELTVKGLRVDVPARPLRVLSLLLARRGEVVTREEFLATIWRTRLAPSDSNVLPTAITRLRNALGPEAAAAIRNVPRRGYRFEGEVVRTLVGGVFASSLALAPGESVPGRSEFVLARQLSQRPGREVWLATRRGTEERRVFKFATDAEHVTSLRREARFSALLVEGLGERADIVRIADWNFAEEPVFIGSDYGGLPLSGWAARDNRLCSMPLAERLALFVRICAPVAASHRVGVLHKDLKPDNILVDERDDIQTVRIADFGSGGLIDPDRLALLGIVSLTATLEAEFGNEATRASFVYLAPEVYEGADASPQSDVYALGVILFQLVAGDLGKPLAPGWTRLVADNEELRETIERATEGDQTRRFRSVDELIESIAGLDARRALNAERRERDAALVRSVRRRRQSMVLSGFLAVGLSITGALFLKASRAERALAREVATVRSLNRFVDDEFIALADPSLTGRSDVTVREAAEKAARSIDVDFAGASAEIRGALHATMQRSFAGLGNYARSIDEGQRALAARPPRAPHDEEQAAVRLALASALAVLSRLDEATAELDSGEALLPEATALANADLAVERWYLRGYIASQRHDMATTTAAFRQADAVAHSSPRVSIAIRDRSAFNLADIERAASHADQAVAGFRAVLDRQRARYGELDARSCSTMVALSGALADANRFDEALRLAEQGVPCLVETLGPGHRTTIIGLERLGYAYLQNGRYAEAAARWEEAIERLDRTLGGNVFLVLTIESNLGLALQLDGRPGDARRWLETALADAHKKFPEQHPLVEAVRYQLAACRLDLHETEGVGALLSGLSKDVLANAMPAPDWDAVLEYEAARLALETGRRDEAIEKLRHAVPAMTTEPVQRTASTAKARALLARLEPGAAAQLGR